MEFFIYLGSVILIILGILIPIICVQKKYKNFVLKNSRAIKKLEEINSKYSFNNIERFNLRYLYDNVDFFNEISCQDFLVYELQFIQKKVNKALVDTLENQKIFKAYSDEIKESCVFNEYGDVKPLANKKRLSKFEQSFFENNILAPQIVFSISVKLILTNINGVHQYSKSEIFFPKDIKYLLAKINQRRGSFFLDNGVWESICRVERGKVSNRMRFAIYERDDHRCRRCGRSTNDLEIDHIIPISKGGKSTYDNLQTLCHRCNKEKGSDLY
jgi:hypothetical protein